MPIDDPTIPYLDQIRLPGEGRLKRDARKLKNESEGLTLARQFRRLAGNRLISAASKALATNGSKQQRKPPAKRPRGDLIMAELHACHDVYLKYTYPNGHEMVLYHRVWDLQLFIKCKREEGQRAKKEEERFTVRRCTKQGQPIA